MNNWQRFMGLEKPEPHPDTTCVCGHDIMEHVALGDPDSPTGNGRCTKCDCPKFRSILKLSYKPEEELEGDLKKFTISF